MTPKHQNVQPDPFGIARISTGHGCKLLTKNIIQWSINSNIFAPMRVSIQRKIAYCCIMIIATISVWIMANDRPDVIVIQTKPVLIATSSDFKIFPAEWRPPPISARCNAIDMSDLPRAMMILTNAISKYPPNVIKSNVDAVYLLSWINYSGIY